jgi:hypothetical protein
MSKVSTDSQAHAENVVSDASVELTLNQTKTKITDDLTFVQVQDHNRSTHGDGVIKWLSKSHDKLKYVICWGSLCNY